MVHEIALDSASAFRAPSFSRARRRQGQTFPEMMIVVAIIAILAAVIIANLFHARTQARISAIMQAEQQIANAAEMYFADYGVYPPSDTTTTVIDAAEFGGVGNPYYNTSQTNPPIVNNNLQQPYMLWVSPGPLACWTSDPCNYGVQQFCSSIDGGDIPSSLLDYDGSTPVKGTLYGIGYQSPQGFLVFTAAQNGC
jgi:prepilin-type N-terminal cleavage/methylation domain-containing protein